MHHLHNARVAEIIKSERYQRERIRLGNAILIEEGLRNKSLHSFVIFIFKRDKYSNDKYRNTKKEF